MPLTQVELKSSNKLGLLPGYASSGNHTAGVIVIQEWWGVNDHIKSLAEEWFSSNYLVVVPDLYRGKVATDHETAGHYMNDLDWKGAVQDIQGAADYLHSIGAQKVGVVGFCMGGALSLAASVSVNGINAAAPFYGIPTKDLADSSKAKVPLQLHFGKLDTLKGFSDPTAQDALEKELKDNNREYEFYRYDAGHAFTNETNKENYNKESSDLARSRLSDFFKKHLL